MLLSFHQVLPFVIPACHLLLGYTIYHSNLLFVGQGDPFLGLLFVPLSCFSLGHSVLVTFMNYAILSAIYWLIFNTQNKRKIHTFFLIAAVPITNVVCFTLGVFAHV